MPEHDPPRDERLAARMRADADARASRVEAVRLVEKWNAATAAGRGDLWSPTIGCAVVAERPWLDVYCPGCRTSRAVDMRTVERNPLATVNSLMLDLRCSLCLGGSPIAVLRGLRASPPAANLRLTL
jgi:hypothetical protein